ncbi:MAG: 50S ribosomal protein L24 [Candidatus Aenigmarchaeota archaeon ex4484_224]|nr:MAG: 50S ribosomal protein L24 [Candidatus Aenigmarchaeota archaeon ex4484_224]
MKKKKIKKQPKSKKPRKQRKFRYNAPLHIRRKFMSAPLSKELREKYKRRSFPIKKGDEVEVLRGEFKGKKGKVVKVDLKKGKIYIDGITRKKSTGEMVRVPIDPSKVRIISLNLSDKKRVEALERKLK